MILYGYWNDSESLDQCYSNFNLSLLMIRKMEFKFEKMIFTFDICKLCKNKKIWYDCKWNNSPQKLNKMTPKSSTIDQCTASKNKQNKYLIFSYKRSKNDNCNTKNKKTDSLIYLLTIEQKSNMIYCIKWKPLKYRFLTWDRIIQIVVGFNKFAGDPLSSNLGQWCNSTAYMNKL